MRIDVTREYGLDNGSTVSVSVETEVGESVDLSGVASFVERTVRRVDPAAGSDGMPGSLVALTTG